MSAVLAAVFGNHAAAEQIRTQLVADGFPTDRVELTSRQELGHAKVVPTVGVPDKLAHYFRQLFPEGGDSPTVYSLQQAVLDGQAVIAVHPRGEIETDRATAILSQGDPIELKAADLQNQSFERAAGSAETPALSRIGKILVGAGRA